MSRSLQAVIQCSDAPTRGALTTADLEGTWLRTDPPVWGITRAVVEATDGGLRVRVASADGAGPADWGAVPIEAVYAALPEARAGVAFTATYNRPEMQVVLHANLSKGLLIIASMARFPDGRRGKFAREFFRKLDGPLTPSEC
jgi:hypothetical protein